MIARRLLLVLVAALPWEDMLYYPNKTLTVVKLLGLLLLIAWVLGALLRNERIVVAPTYLPMGIFAVFLGASYVVSTGPADGSLKVARYMLYMMLAFLVVQLVSDRAFLLRVLRVLAISVALAGTYGLYRLLFVGGISRTAGPIRDANDFAYLLGATLPLVGLLFASQRRQRGLWGLCFVLISAAALATLSRGALVGGGAVLAWAVLSRRIPVRTLLLGVATVTAVGYVGLAAFGAVLGSNLQEKDHIAAKNVASRQAYWRAALEMTAERPLLGVGPERFRFLAADYVRDSPIVHARPVVHNSYLEILSEDGIFALLAFLAYLWTVWRVLGVAGRRARAEGDELGARLATAMQASWIFAVVAATFLSEQLTTPFWLFGGLATVIAQADVARNVVGVRVGRRLLAGPVAARPGLGPGPGVGPGLGPGPGLPA